MPEVKDLNRTAEKWARQSSTSQPEYEAGVRNPRRSWAQATTQAEGNYEAGVQKAISRKAFGKGVALAGDAKWQQNALSKGPSRWVQGISVSQQAYKDGFAPYRQVIENTTLPPRGPKGDPNNIQRVATMSKALHDKKLEMSGG